jgi:hypothetical protein
MHRLSIEGREIIFLNNWRGTGSGFMHETELLIDGWPAADARCYYINRTWERYTYQSVMLEAVHKLQEAETEREKCRFRQLHGIKNIMGRHKSALAEQLENSKDLLLYKQIEEALR